MQQGDFADFRTLMAEVHAFYRQDMTAFSLDVWWQAMRAYDLSAVRQAMSRHVMNPDSGQWMPKPADVVKMLSGRTIDSASVAWSKVDRAVRSVGTYQSVAFDDPLIHRVIADMGGWVRIGSHSSDEWPFVAKEFENRYRGYAMRSERPEYPPTLTGITEAENSKAGFRVDPPVLIGVREQALAVIAGGSNKPILAIGQATYAELDGPNFAAKLLSEIEEQ